MREVSYCCESACSRAVLNKPEALNTAAELCHCPMHTMHRCFALSQQAILITHLHAGELTLHNIPKSGAFGIAPCTHLWTPAHSLPRAALLWGQAYISVSLLYLSIGFHCLLTALLPVLCPALCPFCLFRGMAGRCHAHITPWVTSGILHSFYHALSSLTRICTQCFIFSSTKYSCDLYVVQPNELPDKVHSSASIFSPKETTLHYVHGRTLILLSRGNLKKDSNPNKQPDFCGAESKKCIRKQPFFPPRKSFISAGPTKPHKGKLSSRLINS